MNFIFDLENTLVATRDAVEAAYTAVGVDLPKDFHVRNWREFCTEDQHTRKNQIYHHFAYKMRILPAMALWRSLPTALILSGISEAALEVLLQNVPVLEGARIIPALPRAKKVAWIAKLKGGGLYVDDDVDACLQVRQLGGWQVLHAKEG